MLRISQSSMVRSDRSAVHSRRPLVLITPSAVKDVEVQDFAEPRPFERFGTWAAPITVARDGTIRRLARWLALHRGSASDRGELWRQCQQRNPACFRQFRVVRMAQPSFFLPAGEAAFEVLTNPTQIPDRPPTGVMLRHLEAMDAFPGATFYFLRPLFVADPYPRLCLPAALRQEAWFDQHDAFRTAHWLGWSFRAQVRLAALARRAATKCVRAMSQMTDSLNRLLSSELPAANVRDLALRRPLRQRLESRLAEAESLGLEVEIQRLRWSLEELRRRVSIDPILCFELPERSGVLWFEAHWYDGVDGRTYVHF